MNLMSLNEFNVDLIFFILVRGPDFQFQNRRNMNNYMIIMC